MKRMRGIKFICMMVLSICIFWCNSVGAHALSVASVRYLKPAFDAEFYCNKYPDVKAVFGTDVDALYKHYINNGLEEARFGSKEFNCYYYMLNSPDLRNLYGTRYIMYVWHYLDFGKAEGRIANQVVPQTLNPNRKMLGTSTIKYNPYSTEATNIKVSADRINGLVLDPGKTFSFINTTLLKDEEPGYVRGSCCGAANATKGACYTATALNTALVNGGFKPTCDIPNFSKNPTPGYVPMCQAINLQDLKFVNISGKKVQLEARTNDATGTLTVSVYYIP